MNRICGPDAEFQSNFVLCIGISFSEGTEGQKLLSESRSAEVKVGPKLREMTENWESLLQNCKEKRAACRRLISHCDKLLKTTLSTDRQSNAVVLLTLPWRRQQSGGFGAGSGRTARPTAEFVGDGEEYSVSGELHGRGDSEQSAHTIKRYNSLSEPMQRRRHTLEAWHSLFQFQRDLELEEAWISEALPSVRSSDLGNTLSSSQQLLNKHQELSSRSAAVKDIQEAGRNLVRARHFASHDVRERLDELKRLHEQLKSEAQRKEKLLQEALRIHSFMAQVSELEERLEEQRSVLDTSDCGRDEDTTQALLKVLDTVDAEMENQRKTVAKLQETGAELENLRHPNSSLVSDSLPVILDLFETLLRLSSSRRSALSDQLRLYAYDREAKELQTWLTSKKSLAESEECGQDLEGVEVLQKKLEGLVAEVSGLGRSRLSSVQQLVRGLQRDAQARNRDETLIRLWEELSSALTSREQKLRLAREVHQFNHDAEELKSWMAEKDLVLDSEDPDQDLLSVQTLFRRHQTLERDLGLISEEVSRCRTEGRALIRRQPQVQDAVERRLEELDSSWKSLQLKAANKRNRLERAQEVWSFMDQSNQIMSWLKQMSSLLRAESQSVSGSDLDQLIRKHAESRVQIERQTQKCDAVREEGKRLLQDPGVMSAEVESQVESRVSELLHLQDQVVSLWEELRVFYEEERELFVLKRELEQAERWISSHERMITSQEYGDSVSDVLELLKRQEDLEAMIQAQNDRFSALQKKTTQREKRLQLLDKEHDPDRKTPVRVSSLKRKPSDPKVRPASSFRNSRTTDKHREDETDKTPTSAESGTRRAWTSYKDLQKTSFSDHSGDEETDKTTSAKPSKHLESLDETLSPKDLESRPKYRSSFGDRNIKNAALSNTNREEETETFSPKGLEYRTRFRARFNDGNIGNTSSPDTSKDEEEASRKIGSKPNEESQILSSKYLESRSRFRPTALSDTSKNEEESSRKFTLKPEKEADMSSPQDLESRPRYRSRFSDRSTANVASFDSSKDKDETEKSSPKDLESRPRFRPRSYDGNASPDANKDEKEAEMSSPKDLESKPRYRSRFSDRSTANVASSDTSKDEEATRMFTPKPEKETETLSSKDLESRSKLRLRSMDGNFRNPASSDLSKDEKETETSSPKDLESRPRFRPRSYDGNASSDANKDEKKTEISSPKDLESRPRFRPRSYNGNASSDANKDEKETEMSSPKDLESRPRFRPRSYDGNASSDASKDEKETEISSPKDLESRPKLRPRAIERNIRNAAMFDRSNEEEKASKPQEETESVSSNRPEYSIILKSEEEMPKLPESRPRFRPRSTERNLEKTEVSDEIPEAKPRSGRFTRSRSDPSEDSTQTSLKRSEEATVKPALAPKPRLTSAEESESGRKQTPPTVSPPPESSWRKAEFTVIQEEPEPITEQDSEATPTAQEVETRLESPALEQPEMSCEQSVRLEGTLEIKVKQGGSKLDHWEQVFAVLHSDSLRLYHDKDAAAQGTSRFPPISLRAAVCRENVYYRRKENTFKLVLEDGSQYLFSAHTKDLQQLWIRKLQKQDSDSSDDSDDSGRASSVNVSLEKLTDAAEETSPHKPEERREEEKSEGEREERREEEREEERREEERAASPPPKPPHTYYNLHCYKTESGPDPKDPTDPPAAAEETSRERPRISVLRRLFRK
ncbi:hypothetical protein WMY93_032905 [Mugilogobius chulae]|uniref:PH domain-containing protein n=1 Tax=Mugilogobius chulae TaxID=88201 RepID=A0AAW0MK09_9GOBI